MTNTTETRPALTIANYYYRLADLSPRMAEAWLADGHTAILFRNCAFRAGVEPTAELLAEVATILAGWED